MHWLSELRKICRLNTFVPANNTEVRYHAMFSKSVFKNLCYKRYTSGHNFLVHSPRFSSSNVLTQFKGVNACRNFHSADDSHNFKDSGENELASDVELQNLLKDFARDFEVTTESSKILEEIKRKQEQLKENTTYLKSLDSANDVTRNSFSSGRFKVFSEEGAPVIRDYHEEQGAYDSEEQWFHIDQEADNKSYELTERGKSGVFDLPELVAILKKENLLDISVIEIPKSYHYADYMVLVTAKSPRHLSSFTQFINKQYKMKKNQSDAFLIVEGEKGSSWKALDMGNIVLHLFLRETRNMYDIESLWTLDREYDTGGIIQVDPVAEMMQQQLDYLNSLQPPQAS